MSIPLTRRILLQGSVACVPLGVYSSQLGANSLSPNEKLNIAVIGVGNRGVDNIAGIAGENVAALCDVDARHLDAMARRYPKAKRYKDFRKAIEQKDLDGVIVCTPDHTHAHATAAALHRKLHVYCERPLAHNIAEVRFLSALAKRSGVATQMGNQHHSSHGYARAVEILHSGTLGEIHEAHCWTNRPLWPQGLTRLKETPQVPAYLDWNLWLGPAAQRAYHPSYHPMNWRGYWDFGTGAIGDFGPHIIDPIYTGLRLSAPRSITLTKSTAASEESPPEAAVIEFEFDRQGKRGPLKLTWYDGMYQPPQKTTGLERLPVNGALVIGSNGKLFIPALGRMPTPLRTAAGSRPEIPPASDPPKLDHWQQWLTACKTGQAANSNFSFAAGLTELCLLGNIAIRANRPLSWDATAGKITNFSEANQYLGREYRQGWELC